MPPRDCFVQTVDSDLDLCYSESNRPEAEVRGQAEHLATGKVRVYYVSRRLG